MTYRYCVDRDVNCVFVEHFGDFELAEIQSQFDEMFESTEFRKGMNVLRDIRTVSLPEEWNLDWIMPTTRSFADANSPKLGESRIAWVVGSARDFGRLNQVRIVLENEWPNIQRRPFYDLVGARGWLGIPEEYEIHYRGSRTGNLKMD